MLRNERARLLSIIVLFAVRYLALNFCAFDPPIFTAVGVVIDELCHSGVLFSLCVFLCFFLVCDLAVLRIFGT